MVWWPHIVPQLLIGLGCEWVELNCSSDTFKSGLLRSKGHANFLNVFKPYHAHRETCFRGLELNEPLDIPQSDDLVLPAEQISSSIVKMLSGCGESGDRSGQCRWVSLLQPVSSGCCRFAQRSRSGPFHCGPP